MYVAEAVQLLSYMRHTGTAFSVPHVNDKPPDTPFLPIGRMVQTITNPTLGSINSCVLTQPRSRSPAPKANATSRVLTDSSLTALAFYPLLCLSEPPFGTIPLMVSGDLEKSSNLSNVLGRYVVRFLDNPGPAQNDLPESAYNSAPAPCHS